MSVEQTNKIDIITIAPDQRVRLTVSDHLAWDEEDHLELLQDKLNSYLDYIESGQLFESYPETIGKQPVIAIYMQYEPNAEAVDFFNQCKEIINNENIDFEWSMLNE